jgi:hypothetical protein
MVKSRSAAARNHLEGARQIRIAKDFPGIRSAPIEGQFMSVWRRFQLILRAALPGMCRDRGNREPLPSEANGRGENIRHRKRTVFFDEIEPTSTCAGDRDRMRVERRQFGGETIFL